MVLHAHVSPARELPVSRALALLVLFAGCLEAQLVPCGSDLLCPATKVCDPVHTICVDPDQLASCADMPDGAPCNAGGSVGECRDQVCLFAVCGDHFVEPGEACDDGNLVNGDGCNASCTSTEVCGNGTVDLTGGESCDDANLISGDGCDSRCRPEQLRWTLEGVGPLYQTTSGHMAFDPARRQAVYVADGITWNWDGTRWSLLSTSDLPRTDWQWSRLVFDADRGKVVLVGSTVIPTTVNQVWEWDGTTWTRIPTIAAPAFGAASHVVHDRAHHVLLLIQTGTVGAQSGYVMWALDLVTGVWTQQPSILIGSLGNGYDAAGYDQARGRTVLMRQENTTVSTYEWDGTAWSVPQTAPLSYNPRTVIYDGRLGALVAVGSDVVKWTGTTWTVLAAETLPAVRSRPEVAYDSERQRRIVFAGLIGGSRLEDLYEWDGAQWSRLGDVPSPYEDFELVYDTKRRHLIHYGGRTVNGATFATTTFSYDGTWHRLAPSPINSQMNPSPTPLAYDPIRDAVVMSGPDASTWLLRGDTWEMLEAPGTSLVAGARAIAFDPQHGRVIGVIGAGPGGGTFELRSDADHWTMVAGTPLISSLGTSAFDARTGEIVMCSYMGITRYDGQAWAATVSPGASYTIFADQRRGTVEVVSATRSSYERIDGVWYEGTKLPFAVDGRAYYASDTGEVGVIGMLGAYARVIAHRRWVGEAPLDACRGGDDDGDGAIDCDDPECFWSCTPACPPLTSCL